MRAIKLEVNQRKTEAIVEHYEGVPHAEAMHFLAALQDWATEVLHAVPNGATYEETYLGT
jgi:hypothetical protein